MKNTRISIVKLKLSTKWFQKCFLSLLIRVEVGSERSIIGKTFHKRETLLKKKCWVIELEDLWWISLLARESLDEDE